MAGIGEQPAPIDYCAGFDLLHGSTSSTSAQGAASSHAAPQSSRGSGLSVRVVHRSAEHMALMRERRRALKLERRHAAAVSSATLDPATCAAWNESFGLRAGDCLTASAGDCVTTCAAWNESFGLRCMECR